MQLPILQGIYVNAGASDFRTSYPRNLVPVPKSTGIATEYLAPAEGLYQIGTLPGVVRGSIVRNGTLYVVAGNSLVSISSTGVPTVRGTIPGSDRVTMDYSFSHLAIAAGGDLYLNSGSTVTQVTDVDLGTVLSVVFVDGYFMTTDGTSLVVTELNDPFSVDPLKYGSAEADPDPIKCVLKVRNEVHAVGRYTIEVFDNVGGATFPFQRIEGAQIGRGTLGAHTACVFGRETIAFLGGGRGEQTAVWIGGNGTSTRVSTREIETILAGYDEGELSDARVYERQFDGHALLMIALRDQTLAFDANATRELQVPVWFTLTTSVTGLGRYRGAYPVFAYGKWWAFDTESGAFGWMGRDESRHWGESIGWDFGAPVLFNEGRGVQVHEVELACLPGRVTPGHDPTVWMQYSRDGQQWSQERPVAAGTAGQTLKRLVWHRCGMARHWRVHRFRGSGDCRVAIARLDARVEELAF